MLRLLKTGLAFSYAPHISLIESDFLGVGDKPGIYVTEFSFQFLLLYCHSPSRSPQPCKENSGQEQVQHHQSWSLQGSYIINEDKYQMLFQEQRKFST